MKNILVTKNEPNSPISECFKILRTNIQFKNLDKKLKTILVTSTMQDEGKSTITANLAVAFAQAGKKTLIIDADMRRTKLHKIFAVSQAPGLSNYLLGIDENGDKSDTDIFAAIKETNVSNLNILTAGSTPINPSELLASNKMNNTIETLKSKYDIIIFDGTPCMLVTDSIILSRIVDTTLLLTAYKETKIENLKKIKRDIENVGGNIVGVIFNKLPISQNKYKNKYYYGNSQENIISKENELKEVELEPAAVVEEVKTPEPVIVEKDDVTKTLQIKVEETENKVKKLEEQICELGLKIKELEEKEEKEEKIEEEPMEASNIIDLQSFIGEKTGTNDEIWYTKPERSVKLYEIEVVIGKKGEKIIRELNDSLVVSERKMD